MFENLLSDLLVLSMLLWFAIVIYLKVRNLTMKELIAELKEAGVLKK